MASLIVILSMPFLDDVCVRRYEPVAWSDLCRLVHCNLKQRSFDFGTLAHSRSACNTACETAQRAFANRHEGRQVIVAPESYVVSSIGDHQALRNGMKQLSLRHRSTSRSSEGATAVDVMEQAPFDVASTNSCVSWVLLRGLSRRALRSMPRAHEFDVASRVSRNHAPKSALIRRSRSRKQRANYSWALASSIGHPTSRGLLPDLIKCSFMRRSLH